VNYFVYPEELRRSHHGSVPRFRGEQGAALAFLEQIRKSGTGFSLGQTRSVCPEIMFLRS